MSKVAGNAPDTDSQLSDEQSVEIRRKNSDINVMLQLPYYHPFLSNVDQITHIMAPYRNQSGHFLLRNSFSRPGTYTVSIMHSSGIRHISIDTSHDMFYLQDKPFSSMPDLVQYYSLVPVPNEEDVGNVMLQFPIKRNLNGAGISREGLGDDPRPASYLQLCEDPCTSEPGQAWSPPSSRTSYNETYNAYYSILKEPKGLANRLISHLQDLEHTVVEEKGSDERCECGLLVEDSRLPLNWSVHVSREPVTYGRIFFLGPDGNTTWELPMKVAFELAADQQDRLRDLLRASDNYVSTAARMSLRPLPEIPPNSRASYADGETPYSNKYKSSDQQRGTPSSSPGSSSSFSTPSSPNNAVLYWENGRPIADYGVLSSPSCDTIHTSAEFKEHDDPATYLHNSKTSKVTSKDANDSTSGKKALFASFAKKISAFKSAPSKKPAPTIMRKKSQCEPHGGVPPSLRNTSQCEPQKGTPTSENNSMVYLTTREASTIQI